MRSKVRELFDGMMSGLSAHELQQDIAALALTDRAALLCTLCAVRDEVGGMCKETAHQIEKTLVRNCGLFATRGLRCDEAERPTLLPLIGQPPQGRPTA